MKRTLIKSGVWMLVILIATFAALEISGATNYTYSNPAQVKNPAAYGPVYTLRYSHTFIGRTDTAVFGPFTLKKGRESIDTVMARLNIYLGKASDSTNVKVVYQYSSVGGTYNAAAPQTASWSPFIQLLHDSTVGTRTGDSLVTVPLRVATHGGYQPYGRLLVIGVTALAGGKANEAGNTVKADLLE